MIAVGTGAVFDRTCIYCCICPESVRMMIDYCANVTQPRVACTVSLAASALRLLTCVLFVSSMGKVTFLESDKCYSCNLHQYAVLWRNTKHTQSCAQFLNALKVATPCARTFCVFVLQNPQPFPKSEQNCQLRKNCWTLPEHRSVPFCLDLLRFPSKRTDDKLSHAKTFVLLPRLNSCLLRC